MPRPPFLAIADDLTGAAEIAAFGLRHGLDSTVVTGAATAASAAGLLVFDTDSRLDEPPCAREKLSALGRGLAHQPREIIYKKTDSVLRGAVRIEVEALAAALGFPRVLLLPANPTLGRTIRGGRYAIDGVALHQTAFARDPHHPAATDSVRDLLGDARSLPVAVHDPGDALPPTGIVVCNAATAADVQAWARRVGTDDLPAGGGEFFSALLSRRGLQPLAPTGAFSPAAPALIVSGTTSTAGATLRENARRDGIPVIPMPAAIAKADAAAASAIQAWIEAVRLRLNEAGAAVAVFDGPVASDVRVAAAIRDAFARCVGELVACGALQHLLVEGGATAASIARRLGWHELRMAHEWAHGVASLRPDAVTALVFTMKPGSYAWPEALWRHILRARPAARSIGPGNQTP